MKTILSALALACSLAAQTEEPKTIEIIAEMRAIIIAPDQWVDIMDELLKLDLLAKRSNDEKKLAIEKFRLRLASYGTHFSDHPFTLSADEKSALAKIIDAYEEIFSRERERILKSKSENLDKYKNSPPTGRYYWSREGDSILLRCFPIFAKHSSSRSQLMKIAGNYIEIVRAYGHILDDLTVMPLLYEAENI